MAILIIHTYGGIVNEVYSNLSEPVAIMVYDSDDIHDPEHAHLFAACDYAASFAGLKAHIAGSSVENDRVNAPLERRPESQTLVSDLCRAVTEQGAAEQALDAAFAAGYLEAIGELNAQMDVLLDQDAIDEKAVRRQIGGLLDRQFRKYFSLCEKINEPARYDLNSASS